MKDLFKALFLAVLFSCGVFAAERKVVSLDSDDASIVFTIEKDSTLGFVHVGKKITDVSSFEMRKTNVRSDYPIREAYPSRGTKATCEPAISAVHDDGDINLRLKVEKVVRPNFSDKNLDGVSFVLRDEKKNLKVYLDYTAYKRENVFKTSMRVENGEGGEVDIQNRYSLYLPLKAGRYFLTELCGHWATEAIPSESELTRGIKTIQSRKLVRATQAENPSFVVSLDAPKREESGEVVAGALAWSGNFKLNFELDEYGILGVSAGVDPEFPAKLKPGGVYSAPEAVFTYSAEGVGKASRNLHDWARNYGGIHGADKVRPTLLNNWEGTYFDFNESKIFSMIDSAARLGVEMFVLDDGWFGERYPRNNSKAGLGDWTVNRKKLPRGLGALADYAASKGLKFGVWIEPEMVNPNSELAKSHPEWIVSTKGREATLFRGQLILDLSNPEVQDFVFGVFDSVMKSSDKISYIKWDANRNLEGLGSSYLGRNQGDFYEGYVRGLYSVYERIRQKYPNVMIQACASGGGRVEYGAMKYHDEFWTSDNTDPRVRLLVQYGTSLIYPPFAMGSHVSASPNHQSGNMSSLKFRFDVAMAGRLGMELQPENMSDEELAFARNAIKLYKDKIRPLVLKGDLYRIMPPSKDIGVSALSFVSKDKSKAVAFFYRLEFEGRISDRDFKLAGLDPQKHYVVREVNSAKKSSAWFDGKIFSGEFLMNCGLNPDIMKTQSSLVITVDEIPQKISEKRSSRKTEKTSMSSGKKVGDGFRYMGVPRVYEIKSNSSGGLTIVPKGTRSLPPVKVK